MPRATVSGIIKFLRVNEQGYETYGPAGNDMQVEIVVVLDSVPNMGFGLDLKDVDPRLSSHLAMLSLLRDAYIHKLKIEIVYNYEPGKTNFHIKQIDLHRQL